MTNKLGIVYTGGTGIKFIQGKCPHCPNNPQLGGRVGGIIIQVPEDRQDVPDGFIAYLDRTGMLQFTEEDPHDYR